MSGDITGGSIVENMSGYSFAPATIEGLTYAFNYAGAVKNGNKLTFAMALRITRSSDEVSGTNTIGVFYIPPAIGAKLYDASVGQFTALDFKHVTAVSSADSSAINIGILVEKYSNSEVLFRINWHYIASFPLNTMVFLRIEETFLLSDNLAS